ncbi:hypothetical protein C2G38_2222720 [Gigaspora rosea]|uniref:Uncharacterized protein n=1 Tax=Gigaspora rosea TaxID=44941 RepID=A0A397UAZ9_9GLOM|nr:hypothetical protein C2G38_2222720 [Gigaspora rosea]
MGPPIFVICQEKVQAIPVQLKFIVSRGSTEASGEDQSSSAENLKLSAENFKFSALDDRSKIGGTDLDLLNIFGKITVIIASTPSLDRWDSWDGLDEWGGWDGDGLDDWVWLDGWVGWDGLDDWDGYNEDCDCRAVFEKDASS